MLNGEITKPES